MHRLTIKNILHMKIKSVITLLLFACIFSHSIHAQQILKPAEPNDICMEAWQKYHKADVLWKKGWGLFGGGMGICIGGCALWAFTGQSDLAPSERNLGKSAAHKAGVCTMIIGSSSVLASIPCLAVGQVRRKAARRIYQEHCSQDQPPLTFNLQPSAYGLGIAMCF